MPMFETNIPCPICNIPLTDVDGMLECQNPKNEPHFIYGYGKPYFNFDSYIKKTYPNHPYTSDTSGGE